MPTAELERKEPAWRLIEKLFHLSFPWRSLCENGAFSPVMAPVQIETQTRNPFQSPTEQRSGTWGCKSDGGLEKEILEVGFNPWFNGRGGM